MKIVSNVKIRGIGGYLPEKVITNDDLSKIVNTNDEWITTRTGIRERREAGENEGCVDMAYKAVMDLADQGYKIDDVDLIIVATMSPDHYTPSVSAQLQGSGNGKQLSPQDGKYVSPPNIKNYSSFLFDILYESPLMEKT